MKQDRRGFLYSMGILGYALGVGSTFDSIKVLLRAPKGRRKPALRANAYGEGRVSAVGGSDAKSMVAEALRLLGGLEKIGIRGKTVLIKPNIVAARRNPTTTNPEVVRAAVSLLYEAGAREVVVGDLSALIRMSTKQNMERTGVRAAAQEAGARVVYFEDFDWYTVRLAGARYIKEVAVSEWIYRADRVINLPVIKTHRSAGYSICLKNFIGATHFRQRPYFVDSGHWEEVVAEINLAYSPDLNIVDGTVSMIEGGPWKGTEASTGLVLASGDRLAADAVGLALIRSFGRWKRLQENGVWGMTQLRRAVELGMGVRSGGAIELLSASLDGSAEFRELIGRIRENLA